MNKKPFKMGLLVLGAIFVLSIAIVLAFSGATGSRLFTTLGEKVAVVEISGPIINSQRSVEQLERHRKDTSVKAVVVRVDSPGGGVGASQEIHTEVLRTAEVKPVVVSMAGVAASGGYYLAAPATRILANPGTITGSIGVIMGVTNIQELLEKIGLRSEVVKSGEFKDVGSPLRPWTDHDRRILQGVIEDVHQQFIVAVASGRGMSVEEVTLLADGRIMTGQQALEAGLVDALGNLPDAIRIAADLAGIEGDPKVIYPPRERGGILDYLLEGTIGHLQRGLQERSNTGLQYIWPGF
jgi:protease IV